MFRYSLLLGIAVTARVAPANDLLQLYRLALTRDVTLQTATFERDAAIESRPQALSPLLPQIGAQATTARERAGYDSTTLQSALATNCTLSAGAQTGHCYSDIHGYALTLSQTLWSFESFSRLKEAYLKAASAEATLLGAKQSLLLRLTQAYFGILSAQDQLATLHKEREAFGTLLNQAQTRTQTGVGPRSDVEQAQSFYDATEESVIDAENLLDEAELALTEIVGAPATDIAPLREDIPMASPEPPSVDAWVESALRDNPGVRAHELQVEAAERDISVQVGKALPTLTLGGTSSRTSQEQWLGGNQTLDTISLSVNWPLFQGGAVASGMRQSRALYRQAEAQYAAAQRDTERQARAAYRGVVSGIRRIAAARRAVDSGATAVEASRRNVEFGTGSEFELLNAQNNYYAARRAYSQTRYDYLTAVLTLKQLAGRLGETDLEAVDALLVVHLGGHE